MRKSLPVAGNASVDWSRKAIACCIFAVLGFATLWFGIGLLFAAVAAVFGHLARHETASSAGLRGRGFATVGLWLGYASMLSFPVLAAAALAAFPALGSWRAGQASAHHATSRANASRLFVACEAYARANRDRYPVAWEELKGRYLPSTELDDLLRSSHPGGAAEAFQLVPHDRPVLPAMADSVVVIQESAPSEVRDIAVVYANGTVANLHNPDHEIP